MDRAYGQHRARALAAILILIPKLRDRFPHGLGEVRNERSNVTHYGAENEGNSGVAGLLHYSVPLDDL